MKKRSHLWVAARQNTVSHFVKLKYTFTIMIIDRNLCMFPECEKREVQASLYRLTLKLVRQFRKLIK